jgi:putative addiction module component (TIGR02574 family)
MRATTREVRAMSVDAILKEVEALTSDERAELRSRMEEQFPEGEAEISAELAAFLDAREAAYQADPANVYTWEEVVEYVRRKK